jgi:hypothetical protein
LAQRGNFPDAAPEEWIFRLFERRRHADQEVFQFRMVLQQRGDLGLRGDVEIA